MTLAPDANDLYRALRSSGRLSELRRLTYRCDTKSRCLLLDVVETPMGVLLHQRRYKYSPEENERRSSDSGRRANTYDGDNHWRERSYFLEQSALSWESFTENAGQDLTCDHVLAHRLTARAFQTDWKAQHAEVRVHPRGTRAVL